MAKVQISCRFFIPLPNSYEIKGRLVNDTGLDMNSQSDIHIIF
jgi:hypothetical protein